MTLTIPKDANFAYQPVMETPEQMKSSFFSDVYSTAERHINTILEPSKADPSDELPVEHSNIIAFTGSRGAGKTSVMGNFSKLLHSGKRLEGAQRQKEFFECLSMIDPSHISPDETVIDIVLSRMFGRFETHCKHNEVVSERKRELYQAFSDTYQAVRVMCQDRQARHNILDSLEGLQNAVAGNNLRELMSKLVNLLLQELGRGKNKAGYLVLCVDDIDMNIQQGYNICEDMRKYLNIPHVIILFSLHIGQMNDLVRQQYLRDFDTHLRYQDDVPLTESVSVMANKYLEKLIPFDRRCALPQINFQTLKHISIQYEEESSPRGPLLDELLCLLYEKSGLILVKSSDGTHSFFPTELRGVNHFITLLRTMESVTLVHKRHSYQLDAREQVVLEKNLDTLSCFIQEYYFVRFPKTSATILKAMLEEPQENLNLRVTRMMVSAMDEPPFPPLKEKPSVGDVLAIMRLYSKAVHYDDGMDGLFSALFKVLYSIRVLQTFLVDGEPYENPDQRKLRLHQLLGTMVYNADWNNLCRGDTLCHDILISSVKGAEGSPEFDNMLDELLIGTVCMGRPEPDKNSKLQFTPYLSHPARDDEDVSRNALTGGYGNTFKYFMHSYLGCILSPLRSDLEIKNSAYLQWRQTHLSPLPILSADCIDAYVTGMYRATINLRKSTPNISIAVSRGSRNLIQNIIDRSCVDKDSKSFWEESLRSFPFLQENSLVEKYFFAKDKVDPQKFASLTSCYEKMRRMLEKYQNIDDLSHLINTFERLDNSGDMQPAELNRLKSLSTRLKLSKEKFKGTSAEDPDNLTTLKFLICQEINFEMQMVNAQLEKLSSP